MEVEGPAEIGVNGGDENSEQDEKGDIQRSKRMVSFSAPSPILS